MRPLRSSWSSEWCAQVTVVPEVSRISVLSSGKCHGSKTSMPFGGQWPPVNCGLGDLDGAVGREARIEEGPEPGDEEHHLRGDEQDHPVAQAELDDAGVEALVRFLDDVPPPDQHRVEHADDAGRDQPDAGAVHVARSRRPPGRRPRWHPASATGSGRPGDRDVASRAPQPWSPVLPDRPPPPAGGVRRQSGLLPDVVAAEATGFVAA